MEEKHNKLKVIFLENSLHYNLNAFSIKRKYDDLHYETVVILTKIEYMKKKKISLNKKIEFLHSTYQKLVKK